MEAMTSERRWLASYLDDGGWHTEAENVRNGIDLESYETDLRLIDWLRRHTHLAQPAQAVDVGVIREVIVRLNEIVEMADRDPDEFYSFDLDEQADKLTRALSGEKAEGWRDIATAPNDGTVVLLAIEKPGYSGMALAYQKDGQWHCEESDAAFGGWTHWMPLPASPTPDKEGA